MWTIKTIIECGLPEVVSLITRLYEFDTFISSLSYRKHLVRDINTVSINNLMFFLNNLMCFVEPEKAVHSFNSKLLK